MRNYVAIIILCVFGGAFHGTAQIEDNQLWASIKIKKKIAEKNTVSIASITRLNDDISEYQNTSIDIAFHRKFGKGWGGQLLSRTFFIPDQDIVQFVWFDINYTKTWNPIKLNSRLRYHQALDLHEKKNPDYIRWHTSATVQLKGKFRPFIAIAPWFRLNEAKRIERIRYEAGVSYLFDNQWGLLLGYRREETINLETSRDFNMVLVTLSYSI